MMAPCSSRQPFFTPACTSHLNIYRQAAPVLDTRDAFYSQLHGGGCNLPGARHGPMAGAPAMLHP